MRSTHVEQVKADIAAMLADNPGTTGIVALCGIRNVGFYTSSTSPLPFCGRLERAQAGAVER
jgi:hypothetical protein